jgi:hypothetical protein
LEQTAVAVVTDFYIQFGAVALLAGAGWGVSWLLYKNNTRLQNRYDELLLQVLKQNSDLNETMDKLTTGLKMEDLLAKYMERK